MIRSNLLNFIVTLLFIGMWLSIGSDPADFLFIFFNEKSVFKNIFEMSWSDFINLSRSLFPLICLIICLFIIINFKIHRKHYNYVYILLSIQFIQLITTILSNGSIVSEFEILIDHIGRYHWIISSLSTILIFMIASKLENFGKEKLFYISIVFLSFIVIFFSYRIIVDFFNFEINFSNAPVYNLDVWRASAFFFNHEIPRITGLSRSILVLLIILMFIQLKSEKYFKITKNLLIIFLGSLIFLFQSKFAVILLIILHAFYFFNYKNKLEGFTKIIILILLQIILFLSISNYKFYFIDHKYKNNYNIIKNFTKEERSKFQLDKDSSIRESANNILDKNEKEKNFAEKHLRKINNIDFLNLDFLDHILLSGRVSLWLDSIDFIKERPILGYGSMSDRIIVNQKRLITKKNHILNPISNAFLYSLLSGGIFCLILLILFFITIRKKYLNIFNFSSLNKYQHKIGILILLVISMRVLVENSFMLFGIDFILLLNSLYLTEKK